MSNILKLTLICSLIFHVLMGKAAGVGELKQIKENYRQMLIPSSIEQDSLLSDLIKIKPEKEMSDQAVVELHQLYPFDLKKIDGYQFMLPSLLHMGFDNHYNCVDEHDYNQRMQILLPFDRVFPLL